MGVLSGKSVALAGDDTALSRVIAAELTAAGAKVTDVRPGESPVDGVVAVVSVCVPAAGGAFGETNFARFAHVLEGYYVRNFVVLKQGVPALRRSGGGVFIAVTSADGLDGNTGDGPRCAASNGIAVMTKAAAVECAARNDNVRVNAVMVGDKATDDDVAKTIVYLASDASAYLTALILPVGQ